MITGSHPASFLFIRFVLLDYSVFIRILFFYIYCILILFASVVMTTRLYGINCTLRVSPGLLIGFSSFSLQQTTKDVSKLLSFSPPAKSQPSLLSLFFSVIYFIFSLLFF